MLTDGHPPGLLAWLSRLGMAHAMQDTLASALLVVCLDFGRSYFAAHALVD
jgi:hypothetical protein